MRLGCHSLAKGFRGRAVLKRCSVEVRAGECVIVRGRSGGGKSTLLRCLSLLIAPDAGVVFHGDVQHEFPSTSNNGASVYPLLTVVFQQIYLWPNLTIGENISIVVDRQRRRSVSPAARVLLDRLHVAETIDKRPAQCSLGQRQRVAVARAVLSGATFLLLDEPTSALDRRNRADMVEVLAEVKKAQRGLLVVSHDERDFESIADWAFELDEGVLTAL